MGTIVKRVNPSGKTVYRAQIRIKRAGYPAYAESRTFRTKALARAWLLQREAEIDANSDILFGDVQKNSQIPTLNEAIERYLAEVECNRSKKATMKLLQSFSIAELRLDRIRRNHITTLAMERRNGMPQLGLLPAQASTVLGNLQYIRTLLKHAHFVWGLEVYWTEFDLALEGLKRARLVNKSIERHRLPTAEELQCLSNYFYAQWHCRQPQTFIPMYLVIWLAIYSCRREDEITRMLLVDFNRDEMDWLIRDIKHPDGSKGNNKFFTVSALLLPVIDELLKNNVRQKMLQNRTGVYRDSLVPVNSRSISAAFTRACKVLGIEDLHFHDLRHEGATRLAEDGLTIPQIQKITLHDSWRTLQRYVNVRKRSERRLEFDEAMKQAEIFLKGGAKD